MKCENRGWVRRLKRIVWLLGVLVCASASVDAREWTSLGGATIEADLVEQNVNEVVLRKPDGKQVSIRLSKLSSQDHSYLQKVKHNGGEADSEGTVPEHIEALFGDKLVNAAEDDVSASGLEEKVIGVYFSAHWCPPCRQFTPRLVEAYNAVKEDGGGMEIVFVSSDRNEGAMFDYMDEVSMPWLALPFESRNKDNLAKKYQVRGIPRLVILDAQGKVLSDDAREAVMAKGAKAFQDWL